MEKTFKEVIADIKEGEIWESNNKRVKSSKTGIIVEFKANKYSDRMSFENDTKYKLQKKEYTFEEAFKAYENGKEIENIEGKVKFKKKITGLCFYKFEHSEKWLVIDDDANIFSIDMIRGKWYIND